MKMKTVFTILGILLLVFLVIQIVYYFKVQNTIEKYPYTVVKNYDTFEVRNYEARLFTSVKLGTNDYKKASSKGFSVLAGYIFGANETEQKISMTSPVTMSLEDSMTVMFMVPKRYKKEDLPKPDQSNIQFKKVPAKTVAAIAFSGWANPEKIEHYKAKLKSALEAQGLAYTNTFHFFGYNAPFEIINRRNEIIVELEKHTN